MREPTVERLMARALSLAARGAGATHPNPMVGAVLVRQGEVVGEGWHRGPGAPHAEVEALRRAGDKAREATLVVTLEPCDHHGRTPPCTEAVLAAGVRRVVAATRDPNPLVSGKGLRRLRASGVEVTEGVLAPSARELNRAYFHFMEKGTPYVTLKWASSLDGRVALANGQSRWISGEASRRAAHRLRREADAVLVGVGTVAVDDPLLTVREGRPVKQPLRVVLDPTLRTPVGARILGGTESSPVLLVAGEEAARLKGDALATSGVRVLSLPTREGMFRWTDLASALASLGILHLLVEGGGRTASWFLREGAVRRVEAFLAPLLIGGDGIPAVGGLSLEALADSPRLERMRWRRSGADLRVTADLC